jgi:hypothetical protein
VERYKARLVACGNEQEYGVNFYETFAPIMEMQPTVMTIFALGIMWGVMPEAGDTERVPKGPSGRLAQCIFIFTQGEEFEERRIKKIGEYRARSKLPSS